MSGTSIILNDVCEVNDMLQNMSTADKNGVLICDNCGKEGSDHMNSCNKCKMTKYCNAACKKKHRHKHKKDCDEHVRLATEKRNKEVRIAAELHDKKLFKQPLVEEDCPICFLRMPLLSTGRRHQTCCGKTMCSGCIYAMNETVTSDDKNVCPFCRVPTPASEDVMLERERKLVEAGDVISIHNLGLCHRDGLHGYPQDYTKALEFYHQAIDLGHAQGYNDIGHAYMNGKGVKFDEKKAKYYWELGAMGGCTGSRYNLGIFERNVGKMSRALIHFIIAIRGGYAAPLEMIKKLYSDGYLPKGAYTVALQAY